ncbi:MAG: sialidase family protein [Planctomycetota bacterium]
MEKRRIFTGERFPNVVVATDGTVIATWGRNSVRARRSENGGKTWGPPITIAEPGFHGGGVTVDETTGDILAFVQDKHPPAARLLYRSKDHGKTWEKEELLIEKDVKDNTPQMHMAEHGITLRHGKHEGRLLRPARVYGKSSGYNTAIYSDDGGKHWRTSRPFPMNGTGEGAVAELTDGHIYYTSRKHWFKEVADFTPRRSFAWSYDGGETWVDAGFDEVLPDGPRYRGKKGRGPSHQGHFGMMCGLTRLPVKGRDILLYSNADTPSHRRVRMTVWASFDGGATWPVKRLVYEGPSAYSSLTAGRPGTPSAGWIYLQFEGGEKDKYEGAYLARFNLSWVLEGEKTGQGEVPKWVEK